MTTLELDQLSKTYGENQVVKDFRLQTGDGEFIVLLGPSGCGKTTTLRMIAGFEQPTSGTITLDGDTLSSGSRTLPPEKRNMAMMFQSYAVWPHMTVRRNLSYGLKLKKTPKDEMRRRVDDALARVHLDAMADRYPGEMSGGQQQRVALARALAADAAVVLMDEPLSNLDAKLREEMRNELHRLHAELKFTAIYVTHDQSEAMALADRIVVMSDGQIEQIGTPRELYDRPVNEFVAGFIGRANMLDATVLDHEILRVGDATMAYTSIKDRAADTPVKAVIRPGGVSILADDSRDPGDALDAIVESVMYLGEVQELDVRVPVLNTSLHLQASPYDTLRPGDRVRCRISGVVAVDTVRQAAVLEGVV